MRIYREKEQQFVDNTIFLMIVPSSHYRDISRDVDVSMPIYGRKGQQFVDNTIFFMIVPSSGCSLIVRTKKDAVIELEDMIRGIIVVWPFMVVTYTIAFVFGALAWIIVSLE